MSLGSSEKPDLSKPESKYEVNIEEVSEVVRTGLKSLQEKWEHVPERDEKFLSDAEGLFMKRSRDKGTVSEGTPEKINEYFSGKRRDLQELNSSRRGGLMSKISDDSIGECGHLFLDKILKSTSPEEVSAYGEELLGRVSSAHGVVSDVVCDRTEVQKIREAISRKSYNMFGYDSQKTTETLKNRSIEEKTYDDEFLRGFQDIVRDVRDAVITLTSRRLQLLQKSEQPVEKVETVI